MTGRAFQPGHDLARLQQAFDEEAASLRVKSLLVRRFHIVSPPAEPARTREEQNAVSEPVERRSAKTVGDDRHIVPDVRGLSKRKAISLLRDEKFQPVVYGSGVVVSQIPSPGEPVSSGRVIKLTCEPKTSNPGGAN